MTLEFESLSFERNDQLLFKQMSAIVCSGELLQVEGPNGSGKSTLLRILSGLIMPQEGKVLWQNKLIHRTKDVYQQNMHYLSHQTGLKLHLTVQENLLLSSALKTNCCSIDDLQNTLRALNLFHLRDTKATCLSAGQSRRLSLARLLLIPTPLWILDEPLTALDNEGQQLFKSLVQTHLNQGGIAIIATHQSLHMDSAKRIRLGEKNAILS